MFALWVGALLFLGTGLFLWVYARQGAAVAFDVLTQHKTPIGSDLGTAGVLLSSFGYFVAPATIGALVAAAYLASSELSAAAIRRRVDERMEQFEAGKAVPPPAPAAPDVAAVAAHGKDEAYQPTPIAPAGKDVPPAPHEVK